LLDGINGKISVEQVAAAINPDDVHKAISSLVCVENTANRGGGACYELADIQEIRELCNRHNLNLHLDGARLFNALVARKETPRQYGEVFHSISVCLNKGLGCPIGSILIGKKDFIRKARRVRKVFGGGMRQAGYMAASGLYALQHHVDRLAQDHEHARQIADALRKKEFTGAILPVETNIIIFEIKSPAQPQDIVARLKEHDIYTIAISPSQIRMVLHLDITEVMVKKTIEVINSL
jgi:threonine aldolase